MSIETRGLLYADNTNNRTVTSSWTVLSTPDTESYSKSDIEFDIYDSVNDCWKLPSDATFTQFYNVSFDFKIDSRTLFCKALRFRINKIRTSDDVSVGTFCTRTYEVDSFFLSAFGDTSDGFSYPLYLEPDYYYQIEAKTDIGTVRINYTAIQFTRNR